MEAHKVVDQKMISVGALAVDHLLALSNLPKKSDSLTKKRREKAMDLLGFMRDMRAIRPMIDILLKDRAETQAAHALANLRIADPIAFKQAAQGYTEEEMVLLHKATVLVIEDAYTKYRPGKKWLEEYYLPGETRIL
jgi:hypothetical protein